MAGGNNVASKCCYTSTRPYGATSQLFPQSQA